MDASAILAVLFDEPGCDIALAHAAGAAVSTVAVAEVATRLIDNNQEISDIEEIVGGFQFVVHPFAHGDAFECAELRRATRIAGLSLGDRSCLALAKRLGLPAVTADRAWSDVAAAAGVIVHQIR